MSLSRRELFGVAIAGAGALALRPLAAQESGADTTAVQGDFLRDPNSVGRLRDTVTAIDNDPAIIAIERQLKCTCGCTLDIYTCRTTDFTCTFSPALHKEVVAMFEAGKSAEEIIIFFVDREGEKILMAPVPQGFNIAGYLVPGLGMATAGLILAAWLSRRKAAVAAGAGPVEVEPPAVDPEAMARLKRALDEVES